MSKPGKARRRREVFIEETPSPGSSSQHPLKINITVLGCGAIGSAFAEECAKQFYHGEISSRYFDLNLTFIDNDVVEERNCISQNYHYSEVGKPKAEALAERIAGGRVHTSAKVLRIDQDNQLELIPELADDTYARLIVDGVDNTPTRMLASIVGATMCPVLHGGLTAEFAGGVNWSLPDGYSTSPFDSRRMLLDDIGDAMAQETVRFAPCHLCQGRPSIYKTSSYMVWCMLRALRLDRTGVTDAVIELAEKDESFEIPEDMDLGGNIMSLDITLNEVFIKDMHTFALIRGEDRQAQVRKELETTTKEMVNV